MSHGEHDGKEPGSTPPSFVPSHPSRRGRNGVNDAPAPETATPPSFSPGNARRSGSPSAPSTQTPSSFPPVNAARRRSGSTANASRIHPATSAPHATHPMQGMAQPPICATSVRRHRWPRIVAAIIAVIVILLSFGTFGIWHWVNDNLTKRDWSTSTPASNATTWLILGSDERDGSIPETSGDTPGSRTDTILVLIKPHRGSSALISIPRDSLVNIDGTSMKLNAVSELRGMNVLMEQVEHITGHKVDHVMQIQFGGLQNIVNALGGVELCYDQDVNDPYSGMNWQAGCHMADGATALTFSRMRYADANGDFGRTERQRQVIAAIVHKATSQSVMTNPATIRKVGEAAMHAVVVDNRTTPMTLLSMMMTFRNASSQQGISGSVYWTDPGYYVNGVGSTVLLDDTRNTALFNSLADGTHEPGTVGTLAESQQ